MEELDLQPGPALGQLLETLRESRASGQIDTRADALEFARQWLADQDQG
jgi:tRNA nucleotidyltransferase (CCA-adding enzyme)